MFGGSGKMGRGGGVGGGGAGKRTIHAPPLSRPGRASMGSGAGPRGRGGAPTSSPSTSSMQVEESFSLVRESPLGFGMAIKLAPDLVEEIKRVEAQGGGARIKFDVNANNPNGNVIHVGDKIFKFTWSREPGDLCDIYEERQSGEDGNGMLVESGGTWRKLNVERELDESTKNHVKRRSEEAERKHKSRKAIVLDHQNPSMKTQVKAIAAAESNPWRNFKNRKEPPFKKAKLEPASGGPPKSAYKSGLSSTTLSKSKISSGSPLSFQLDQHGGTVSPVGSGNPVKGHADIADVAPTQNKISIASSEKEMHSRLPHSVIRDKPKHKRNMEAKHADLKSLVISLLLEHQPNGMSLKALEKAIGDAMPNSARQLDPILKQVADFRSPGRYFLKPGVENESVKKPLSLSGSSPGINHHQSPSPLKFDQPPAKDPSFATRTAANGEEEPGELNSTPLHITETPEKIDILQNSPQQFSDKKASDNSEGLAGGGSSDSGSDGDSDSSDSDSDSESHSRTKSRSPVGSSSDSESDASISSKQASDEEVDIMSSDDDKESKHKLLDSVALDDESVDVGTYEQQDDHLTDIIEIEKDSPQDDHDAERRGANDLFFNKEVEEIRPPSADHHESQEREVFDRNAYDGPESVVNESFSKGKSKRHHDDKHLDERAHNKKRFKSKNLSQPVSGTISSLFGDSPENSSPDRPLQDLEQGRINVMIDNGNNDPGLQTCANQIIPTRSVSDSQQSGERFSEARVWTEAPSGEKRPSKHDSSNRGAKYSERNLQSNEGFRIQKGFNSEAHSDDERRPVKLSSESDKHPTVTESHHRKSEMLGKVKEAGPHPNSHVGYSPKENNTDRFPVSNGRGSVLRRELSELELGEFREPFHDVTHLPKKQIEKKNSFKQLENKPLDSESWGSDLSREKPHNNKITTDSGVKLLPPNSEAVISSIPDASSKKKASEHYVDDLTRSHHKSSRPLDQHHQPGGDYIEAGAQHSKVSEKSSKSRFADPGAGRAISTEAYGDTSRRMPVNSTEQQHDPIRGVGPHTTKQSKKHKPNVMGDSNGGRIDASLTGSNDGSQKKKESSSDENDCLYTKYDKEKPELKGPIKDASQYKEYVKEYQEKYESYCSLNKILEAYRDEFSKLGKDLEAYKGRDMKRYHDTLKQMRSSFRQCGERHKRQKKIFLVLYEELKHLKQMIKDYAASCKRD